MKFFTFSKFAKSLKSVDLKGFSNYDYSRGGKGKMKKITLCTLSVITFSMLMGITGCGESTSTPLTSENTTAQDTTQEPTSIEKQAHAITFTESENFSVECELSEAKEGETVSFKIVVDNDYTEITSVKVYENVLTADDNGVYSFTMQDKETQVTIEFEDTRVQQPTIKQVITNLAAKRNYSYFLEDKIFNTETKYYFTEKAYYYTYSKDNSSLGLAEDLNGDVFKFALGENDIIEGEAKKDNNGNVVNGLWANAILSFADFNIDALSDEPNLDNTYIIEDDANKLLFAAFAGYADAFVLPYITVSVEVLSAYTFVSTVHFEPEGNSTYSGDCIGTVTAVDETTIPYIDAYIQNGGGAKLSESEAILEILRKIKESKNYKVSVKKGENDTYVDYFTEDYFYSDNLLTPSSSKGHISIAGSIYNFTIVDGEVKLGDEITITDSANKTDVWANSSNTFKNLATINLSDISLVKGEDDKYVLNGQVSPMTSLFNLVHAGGWFATVDKDKDKVVFEEFDRHHVVYTYVRADGTKYTVTIDNIGSTSIEKVDEFKEANKDFDPQDMSKLSSILAGLKDSKSYSINFTSGFGAFSGLSTNSYNITFSETEYVSTCTNKAELSYTLKEENGVVNKYTKDSSNNDVVEATAYTSLWSGEAFKSFKDFDETTLKGKHNFDGTYTITSAETVTLLGNIVYITSASFPTNFSSAKVTIDEEAKTLTITGSSGFYGNYSMVVNY